MTVYLIAEIKVTDDNWVPDYAAKVHPIVKKLFQKHLKNKGLVSFNLGPEFRFTFRN